MVHSTEFFTCLPTFSVAIAPSFFKTLVHSGNRNAKGKATNWENIFIDLMGNFFFDFEDTETYQLNPGNKLSNKWQFGSVYIEQDATEGGDGWWRRAEKGHPSEGGRDWVG